MIPSKRTHLQAAAATHPGMKGKQNEDRYGVSAHVIGIDNPVPSTLAIVSDGIGGHRAGEVAAEMAVEIISRKISESTPTEPQQALKEAVIAASQAIRTEADSDPSKQGMGATCACAWIIGDRLYVTYVGDSRIYLIREETIRQLSIDHTWIREAIDKGLMSPSEAEGHPNQHVIRRFLGSENPPEVDLRLRLDPDDEDEQAELRQGMPLQPGDSLLLCSDGLTDLVEDWEILARMKHPVIEEALEGLIDLANRRGGHDNITMVALRMPEQIPAAQPTPRLAEDTMPVQVSEPARRTLPLRALLLSCLGIVSLIVIGVLAATTFGWISLLSEPTATPSLTQAFATTTPTNILSTQITSTEAPTVRPTRTVPVQPQATYTAWPTSTPLILPIVPFNTPVPTLLQTTTSP